jgi:hypothetical protein
MSRLSNISASPLLRTYAQGAAQSAIKPVARFLAPDVNVPTLVGRYKSSDQKNRFRVPETRRGLSGKAARIGFDASDAQYNCTPHALDFPIDNLEKIEGDQALTNMAQYGAGLIADAATLRHELDVVNLAVTTLTGGAVTKDFTSGAIDPIKEIDALILAVIKAAKNGAPIKVLFGAGAYLDIKNNTNVRGRFTVGGKGAGGQLINPQLDDIAALLFSNPQVMMTTMVQDTAAEGLAEALSFVLDKKVIVFASNDTPNTMDPSFMKTFRLDGQWMVPGSYISEDGRGEVLKMDWSEDIRVTNTTAGAMLLDA